MKTKSIRERLWMATQNTSQRLGRIARLQVKMTMKAVDEEHRPVIDFSEPLDMPVEVTEAIMDRIAYVIDREEGYASPEMIGEELKKFVSDLLIRYHITFAGEKEQDVFEVDTFDMDEQSGLVTSLD